MLSLRRPTDDQIRRYLELGCEVKGMGRGHIKRIKDSIDGKPKHARPKVSA